MADSLVRSVLWAGLLDRHEVDLSMSRLPSYLEEFDAWKTRLAPKLAEKVQIERERHQLKLCCEGWSAGAVTGKDELGAVAIELYQDSQERWGNPGSYSKGGRIRSEPPSFTSWYESSPPTWADGENVRPLGARGSGVAQPDGEGGGEKPNGDPPGDDPILPPVREGERA